MRRKPTNRNRLQWGALALALWLGIFMPDLVPAASPPAGTSILNTAVVRYNDANGSGPSSQSASVQTIVSGAPVSITSTKTATPDPAYVNNPIVYTIAVTNEGTADLTDLAIKDPIPANTTFVSADAGGTTIDGAVVWNIGNLAAGAMRTVRMTVQIGADVPEGSVIQNTAQVTAAQIPYPTPTTTTTVSARTLGLIRFLDASGNPAASYRIGDKVCIEVSDPDRNTDPLLADTVNVVLRHSASGDSETIALVETGADTGIFRGCIASAAVGAADNDGTISVSLDSVLDATYTDASDTAPVSKASVLIDPLGTVFDSVTGAPVAGAVVTLYRETAPGVGVPADTHPLWPAGRPNPVTTDADGNFQFPLVPPGDYYLLVDPGPGHTFPSAVADAQLPAGFVVGTGSRGELFTLAVGDPPLNLDIPVDPPPGQLTVAKTANHDTVTIGEMVRYQITLANIGTTPVAGLSAVDRLPHGFHYVQGSSKFDGRSIEDPQNSDALTLSWPLPPLAADTEAVLSYRLYVGPDAHRGDGTNTVFVSGLSVGQAVTSNTASKKVRVKEGVFTSQAIIIGKVFVDADGDGIQNCSGGPDCTAENDPAAIVEPGVAEVVLYMEDGRRVTTDGQGKFSIPAVDPGTHVLRIDETTLPEGLEPVPISNRFMGRANSQFVDVDRGGLFKANFGLRRKAAGGLPPSSSPDAPPVPPASPVGEKTGAPAQNQQAAASEVSEPAASPDAEKSLEERIGEMSPSLAFIYPEDGQIMVNSTSAVRIKAPAGATVALWVDDNLISAERIGKKMSSRANGVTIFEYVSVGITGEDPVSLRAVMTDSFGNVRGESTITVLPVGEPRRLILRPDKAEAPADGKTVVTVEVALTDKNGRTVSNPFPVTVESSAGEILGSDVDPASPGFQIRYRGAGSAFKLRAPIHATEAILQAYADGFEQKATVWFVPHLRGMMIVGTGDVTVGSGSGGGNLGPLRDKDDFETGGYANGRGALFVKGTVFDDMLLTATYDSDKADRDDLFEEAARNPDGEDKYPIYGDESTVDFEAKSSDNLYLKLEKDRSYALYGDYKTDLNQTRLSAYNRSFTGLKAEIDSGRYQLKAFGTHADQVLVVDTLQGRGISGFYFLTQTPVVEGSERIVIETRDRRNIDRVLSRELVVRGSDYSMDYDAGEVLFKAPVPSHDSAGNPVYIVVSYETRTGAESHYTYGGRGALEVTDWLTFGATGVVEENDAGDYRLYGTDATLALPLTTTVTAEAAWTDSLFDVDNRYELKDGFGWSLDLESHPTEKLRLSGYYRDLSDNFYNPNAVDVMRGTRKYGFDATYRLLPTVDIYGNYAYEKDDINDQNRRYGELGAAKTFDRGKVFADLSYEDANDEFVPPASPDTRFPFDNSEETVEDVWAARIGAEYRLFDDLTLTASHKQDIRSDRYRLSEAGLSYRIDELSRAYVREELAKYNEREEARTALGVESEVAKNTVAYSEYRIDNRIDGTRNQEVIGLRNRFLLGDSVTGNISAEHQGTLSGPKRQSEPDAFAVAAAIEYLPEDDTKLTSRLEYRREIGDPTRDSYLAEIGAAYRLSSRYSLLARERFYLDDAHGDGSRLTNRFLVGVAYRPAACDRFNALGKLEYKTENNSMSGDPYQTNAVISSVEGVYQASPDLQLTGKYAAKWYEDTGFSTYTDLISARILYDITERFDMGVTYRVLTDYQTMSRSQGGAVEFGCRVIENLWLSAGYSFDNFDSDLTGDSYRGQGPYFRIRFKFDEDTLAAVARKTTPANQE